MNRIENIPGLLRSHQATETACNMPWANLEKVLPHVDTMLHDHKLTIPERQRKWTGVDLLPYHRFGLGKYESLGVVYELKDYKRRPMNWFSSYRPSSTKPLATAAKNAARNDYETGEY
jgi:hypothetical protein